MADTYVLMISQKVFSTNEKKGDYYDKKKRELEEEFPQAIVQIFFIADIGSQNRIGRYQNKYDPKVLRDE